MYIWEFFYLNFNGCLIRSRNRLLFASTGINPDLFGGVRVDYRFILLLSYFVSLRSDFRVVMSVTISA